MKSIHERVRAQLEKKARDEKRLADRIHDNRINRSIRAAQREDDRIEALVNGEISPRNAKEQRIVDRLELGDF